MHGRQHMNNSRHMVKHQTFTYSSTDVPKTWKTCSKMNRWNINWYHHTYAGVMRRKVPFTPIKSSHSWIVYLWPKISIQRMETAPTQCNITLNLLKSARRYPSLFVYASLLGNFDYNKTPMAPPGTRIIVHEKSNNRLSWAGHGTKAWCIGPSMEHYLCFKCYMPVTCRKRDADTVKFFLTTIPFPRVSTDNYL